MTQSSLSTRNHTVLLSAIAVAFAAMFPSPNANSTVAPVTLSSAICLAAGDAGDDGAGARIGSPQFLFGGRPQEGSIDTEGSFALMTGVSGGQIAVARHLRMCAMAVCPGEETGVVIPIENVAGPFKVSADVVLVAGTEAGVWFGLESALGTPTRLAKNRMTLTVSGDGSRSVDRLVLRAVGTNGEAVVRWAGLRYIAADKTIDIDVLPPPVVAPPYPIPRDAVLRPILEHELIEWDWRMQDGIGAGQVKSTYPEAIEKTLSRGDALVQRLERENALPASSVAPWQALRATYEELRGANAPEGDARWEALWQRVHQTRRELVFANPLAKTGAILFVKQVPGTFSHQLTQYYGRYARPGGGVYVLERPGESMQTRQLGAGAFPKGSFMHPEVTHDGQRVIVSFCAVDTPPQNCLEGDPGRYYHLYAMTSDGSEVRQLTDGAYNDFAPKELPDGELLFVSTRRGGWHRCGTIGCEVYTLAKMKMDGSDVRTISYHETQEWDPSVLDDGRVVYTRWDYVDRNAVCYQQLWTVRQDGSNPAIYYGNNTYNPVGTWEARAVPGSNKIMATAAPHHGMTAGSIILVDVTKGVDGPGPLTRLTPDAAFPESEIPLAPTWRCPAPVEPPVRTVEMDRWPGHCYRSPWPLSEDFFLAAYSYDMLLGETKGNPANMFGLYLVDAFGNKELLYRDLNLSSAWPLLLRARENPPLLASASQKGVPHEGTYLLKNVYESSPSLAPGSVKRLRIVQVLPKSTPGINRPPVGAANASPGKQVLGTVPVEADGSAYFRAPSGIPMAFQAVDELGQAVQWMRSITYLQPGESASCVGCHEQRLSTPSTEETMALAARRAPSVMEPGPDGSNPLSYPLLVQPVLDKLCVRCHSGEKPAGPQGKPVVLTAAPEGDFSTSYNALVQRVSFSAWGRGTFPQGNSEPLSAPGFFGAKGSPLMKMLLAGHHEVKLDPNDVQRLATWMDANALFYGTFDKADQERQRKGERIAGPALQ